MKVGGAALNQTPLDWSHNFQNISNVIAKAKSQNIELLCLPELCISGYGCEDMFLNPFVTSQSLEVLKKIIPITQNIAIAVGLPMRYSGRVYNALAFIDNTRLKGFYVKQNLPIEGVHYEKRWFKKWKKNKISKYKFCGEYYPFGHLSLLFKQYQLTFEICEDTWVEKNPAASLATKPEIVLCPSASHFAFGKVKKREKIIFTKSSILKCLYIYVNMLGNEAGRVIYDGDIMIAYKGKLVAYGNRFAFTQHTLVSVEIDIGQTKNAIPEKVRTHPSKNEEFPDAVCLGLYDYLRKSRSRGFVLSLSGGADSSVIAILVAEMVKRGQAALGVENFTKSIGIKIESQNLMQSILCTVYQSTQNSSQKTLESAAQLSKSIQATFFEWNIDTIVDTSQRMLEGALNKKLTWQNDDVTLQNIQARTRSPLIWMLANIKNALLLTTSNRSEVAVGYCTMDGDSSGGLAPIGGVDKKFIKKWLQYAEKELNYEALKYVNRLTPSAELRPVEDSQSDEKDLMPYEVLAAIEKFFIHKKLTKAEIIKEIAATFDKEKAEYWVSKFFTLWSQNQWKRERLAPSFHLDDYNLDPRSWFRYPILSGHDFDHFH